jgi:hypothetical protein
MAIGDSNAQLFALVYEFCIFCAYAKLNLETRGELLQIPRIHCQIGLVKHKKLAKRTEQIIHALENPISTKSKQLWVDIRGKIKFESHDNRCFREPYWSLFNYYKMAREFLRFLSVTCLLVLNSIITKSLQIAKVFSADKNLI